MNLLIPLGLYLVAQVFFQHLERKQQLGLSPGENARVIDALSGAHLGQVLTIAVLVLVLGVIIWLDPSSHILWFASVIFIALILTTVLYMDRATMRKLRASELPEDYLQSRARISRIQTVLMSVFFAWVLLAMWMSSRDI